MPSCTVCNMEQDKPPDDVRDWFRCTNCQTALRVPPRFGGILLWISVVGALLVLWATIYLLAFLRVRLPLHIQIPLDAVVLGVYGILGRFVWKTKLVRLRVYYPYSSLQLTDYPKGKINLR
jgi:hypothetical protein